ncbi:trypsin CFT-1-like [Pararge aegeria]|uniref:trypsin CFT-1-like n=1 Tax=Pararge aegeria TaxID=116150 RepID=UPI0019D00999|nr:trypsin CFT-1-like [Pararge aegeria]
MKTLIILSVAICFSAAASLPKQQERIIGGSVTNINTYPFTAALLFRRSGNNFRQWCGATIINNRSALSATHCWIGQATASLHRMRVGSTRANSGGSVHNVAQLISHPHYNTRSHDNDVGVVRVATAFNFGTSVRAGALIGANVNIPDNANVMALGWGYTTPFGSPSEQLRHVELRTINQAQCANAYGGGAITANMLCAGWNFGGRGSCFGDSGTGLVHGNVVIGVTSFGRECASARWPAVYARISRYIAWIRNNA